MSNVKFSTASVALGIALVPLLLMYKTKVDPAAEFLWLLNQPYTASGLFWQSRLADAFSTCVLTMVVYTALRRLGLDRRIRPTRVVHVLIGLAVALPALWSGYLLCWAVRRDTLADVSGLLLYDQRSMLVPMLVLSTVAMVMLIAANWVEVEFSVRHRRVEASGDFR